MLLWENKEAGMNKAKNIEWIKEKFARGKEEVVKFTKVSKLRIEVASEKRKLDEKFKNLGLKVYGLMKDGEIDIESLYPEKEAISRIEQNIEVLLKEIEAVRDKVTRDESFSDEGLEGETDKTEDAEMVDFDAKKASKEDYAYRENNNQDK